MWDHLEATPLAHSRQLHDSNGGGVRGGALLAGHCAGNEEMLIASTWIHSRMQWMMLLQRCMELHLREAKLQEDCRGLEEHGKVGLVPAVVCSTCSSV
jgi:hypothetical protein